jgi:hypothetical protein
MKKESDVRRWQGQDCGCGSQTLGEVSFPRKKAAEK